MIFKQEDGVQVITRVIVEVLQLDLPLTPLQ